MIGLAAGTRIWIVAGVMDMRRGFTGLSGMVQTALQESPFSGQVYISRGRRGDPPVAVASVLAGQRDDVSRQRLLVAARHRQIALRSTPTASALGRRIVRSLHTSCAHVPLRPGVARGLEVSLRYIATSFKICFSNDNSATKRFSFAFFRSRSFIRLPQQCYNLLRLVPFHRHTSTPPE